MARVVVFGGHGKVAMLLHPLLVERGDEVTAIVRNPEHTEEVAATGARPLVADVERLDADAIAEEIRGFDAVVWAAGAGGGDPERTYTVDRDAAIRSMDAAARAGLRRYVMVSYFGADPEHGVPSDNGFFPYAEAKAAADAHLRGTDLDWTVLGPSRLTLEPGSGRIEADEGPRSPMAKGEVPRADVAAVTAEVLHRDDTIRRTIEFNTGATPIAEALGRS
ncbi:SDR family oxidoreductase [Tomitella fengzijianii]|uniref:SDR family oxidoreductase n=1 Tax=Tomitella fengzijianii TaxID=2597660 RepID=A0A516X8L7_9ACTN|nr:SDR family oxidoreductase [Tomitella fengzijianii]QDQ99420.1 SDR family oxidoreductase [Tomitella fengzijianii]